MGFERLVALARDTPSGTLRDAWGVHADSVESVKKGKRPMTVSEVGALAEVHGRTLADVLAV